MNYSNRSQFLEIYVSRFIGLGIEWKGPEVNIRLPLLTFSFYLGFQD